MQSFSPTSRYQQALNDGSHQPDNVQQEAVNRLETIFQALTTPARPAPQESGLRARFGKLLGKRVADQRTGAWLVYVGRSWARKNLADGPVLP